VAATISTVRRIAAEFASVSDDDVQGFLDDAALELSADFWGDLYARAQALVAAHLLGIAHPELALPPGPISAEAVGAVSRSYAVAPAAQNSRWGTSRHGVEYLRLLRTMGPAVRVI
jgi:hypothetical protein